MRGSDFWRLLSEGDREDLISAARSRIFSSGAILCMQGEPTTHVFILQSGWVKIITVTHEGREVLEALRLEGEVVGEIAGQVTGYRTATVQALGTVRALLIGAEQFGDFLDLHPLAGHAYRQAMTEVQQVAYEKQRSRTLLSGAQRLAGLLLDLTEQDSQTEQRGQVNRDATAPPLPLSQEELASLIGASRSTVTRALQGWRSRHIIWTDQRHIEILDRARLERIAGRDSKKPLSPHGKPVIRANAPHERGPLGSRKRQGRLPGARVTHQYQRSRDGDFNTICSAAAVLTLAPGQREVPARPTRHPTSLRSAGRPTSCGGPG